MLSITYNCTMTHWSERTTEIADKSTIGRRQYPRTLTTQPTETPSVLIKFSTAYRAPQPSNPTPYM